VLLRLVAADDGVEEVPEWTKLYYAPSEPYATTSTTYGILKAMALFACLDHAVAKIGDQSFVIKAHRRLVHRGASFVNDHAAFR